MTINDITNLNRREAVVIESEEERTRVEDEWMTERIMINIIVTVMTGTPSAESLVRASPVVIVSGVVLVQDDHLGPSLLVQFHQGRARVLDETTVTRSEWCTTMKTRKLFKRFAAFEEDSVHVRGPHSNVDVNIGPTVPKLFMAYSSTFGCELEKSDNTRGLRAL